MCPWLLLLAHAALLSAAGAQDLRDLRALLQHVRESEVLLLVQSESFWHFLSAVSVRATDSKWVS